ncbi:MAG: winged helix-turn-helix transcriptional regulator [Chloroflexi bacterium]|nr:winged helix-turn-helix transcriptional regulator [Chloroflexota bacterium]
MTIPKHPLANDALHKFLLIHRHLRQVARQMDQQGLRPRQFAVLLYLREQDSSTVSEIQDYLYTSASSASTIISQLEDASYLTRTRSEGDNRVVNVRLTQAGREITQNIPLRGIALLRLRLDSLPDDRLKMLDEAMSDLMQLMEVSDSE